MPLSKQKYSKLHQAPSPAGSESNLPKKDLLSDVSNDDPDHSDSERASSRPLYLQSAAAEGSSAILNSGDESASVLSDDARDISASSLNPQQSPQGPRSLTKTQRAMNVVQYLFPVRQTYERLNNGIHTGRLQSNSPGRFVGQGTDGVFRNLMAKPDTEAERVTQEQHPPTYEEAAADSSPEYWETTMLSPMYENEVFVQGLSVGNLANFVWNALVTVAFQLVGFILCYLLHTSHAAKQGTRAGLGVMFIMFGYDRIPSNFGRSDKIPIRYEPDDPNAFDITKSTSFKAGSKVDSFHLLMFSQQDTVQVANTRTPYIAYGLIAFGIFVIIKAEIDYYKVKQKEKLILAPRALEEV